MSRGTILLVDDEPHIPLVLGRKLGNAGFTVVTASDGEEGLIAAEESAPDLVITDLQMPFMSGIEFAAALASHKTLSRVPIVLLTARGYVLPESGFEEANVARILAKPFSVHQVLEVVEQLIGGDRAEAA